MEADKEGEDFSLELNVTSSFKCLFGLDVDFAVNKTFKKGMDERTDRGKD